MSMPEEPKETLDVCVVGAHPDDVEIGCGGIVARLAEQGYRVGIIDLTDGEPTPESPGPEVRLAEAAEAARVLGAARRITLDLPNRRLFDTFEARVALAKEFRRYRPRLVLGLGGKTPTASPDHYQAALITEAAVFYSRLTKWPQYFGDLEPYTVGALWYFFMAPRVLTPVQENAIVIDVGGSAIEKKRAALACYRSQFPPSKGAVLDRILTFNRQQGLAAGFEAGEIVTSPTALGSRDLVKMAFPV